VRLFYDVLVFDRLGREGHNVFVWSGADMDSTITQKSSVIDKVKIGIGTAVWVAKLCVIIPYIAVRLGWILLPAFIRAQANTAMKDKPESGLDKRNLAK
jgi:hypothetical protein